MDFIRRLARGTALAVVAASLVVAATTVSEAMAAGPPRASAPTHPVIAVHPMANVPSVLGACPSNNVCAWEDAGYVGRFIGMQVGCSDFRTCFASNFNDQASSIASLRGDTFCFYTDINYGGAAYMVPPHALVEYVGSTWNDVFSSAHVFDFFHQC